MAGSPGGVLPISPPLTPRLSPKQKSCSDESGSNGVIVSALDLKIRSRPGPASLTKSKLYFEEEAAHCMVQCHICNLKFVHKSDLYFHLREHNVDTHDCHMCDDRFIDRSDYNQHMALAHSQAYDLKVTESPRRRPGPASRTNAPPENRAYPLGSPQIRSSNLPHHLANQYTSSPGRRLYSTILNFLDYYRF